MKIILTLAFLVTAVVFSCKGQLEEGPSYDGEADEMPSRLCKNKDFCLYKAESYPQETINKILQKFSSIQIQNFLDEKYESRDGRHHSYPECATKAPGYRPVYYIKDNKNKTRVVIQSPEYKVEQKYELKWCNETGRTYRTEHFDSMNLQNVNMTCNNVRTSLDFLVLSLDRTDIERIAVTMPVFCKARYTLNN